MLKVASCMVGRMVISPNFFGLMGCIIMGLRSASSAFIKDATSFFLDVLCVSRCGVSDG